MIIRPFIYSLAMLMIVFSLTAPACHKDGKVTDQAVSVHELFKSKCTSCHSGDQALKLHGTEESFLEIIKRMNKKGAHVSQTEAMHIAGFLSSPNRSLFELKCTKCHNMDRVLAAHQKGTLTRETVMKMRDKGADISEEEGKGIFDFLMAVQPSQKNK